MDLKISKNKKIVLEILEDEIRGDVSSARKKLANDYTMTWVYLGSDGVLFPRTIGDIQKSLEEVYPIRGREYDIKNIAESRNVVMVEMVESYPDPKSKQIYRTPLVLVLEMEH